MSAACLRIRIAPGSGDFESCRDRVEQFCEERKLSPKLVFKIVLALDELITNILSYGYEDAQHYDIELCLSCAEGALRLELRDNGRPFNPVEAAEPELDVPLDERKRPIGGMGIHLVKALMDGLEYRREDGHNVLVLTKRLTECAGGAGNPGAPHADAEAGS